MARYLSALALALFLPLVALADKLLIDQHGEDAPIFAAMQADKCLAAGDLDGKAVWMGVIAAIEELLNQQPPSSYTPLH